MNEALTELRTRIESCPHPNRGYGHRCGDEQSEPCAEVWTCDDCGGWDEELEPHCVSINLSALHVMWTDDAGDLHIRGFEGEFVARRRQE